MARERENEAEAVRTTIVGGRPPGSGRSNVPVPRGIEVLVKKAAVDAEFRELLLTQRGSAAASIELELDPAESAILNVIPREQLARIVDQTEVGTELRPAFLGRAAAVMLAALGASLASGGSPAGAQPEPPTPVAPASQAQAAGAATSPPPQIYEVAGLLVGPVSPAPASPPTNSPPTNARGSNVVYSSNVIGGIRPVESGATVTQPPMAPASTNQPASNAPPATNVLSQSNTYSGRMVITAGATIILDEPITNPALTNVVPPGAATNQPPTNRPPSSGRVTPPFRPAMFAVMIQPAPPKPPSSNPPSAKPSQTNEP